MLQRWKAGKVPLHQPDSPKSQKCHSSLKNNNIICKEHIFPNTFRKFEQGCHTMMCTNQGMDNSREGHCPCALPPFSYIHGNTGNTSIILSQVCGGKEHKVTGGLVTSIWAVSLKSSVASHLWLASRPSPTTPLQMTSKEGTRFLTSNHLILSHIISVLPDIISKGRLS